MLIQATLCRCHKVSYGVLLSLRTLFSTVWLELCLNLRTSPLAFEEVLGMKLLCVRGQLMTCKLCVRNRVMPVYCTTLRSAGEITSCDPITRLFLCTREQHNVATIIDDIQKHRSAFFSCFFSFFISKLEC